MACPPVVAVAWVAWTTESIRADRVINASTAKNSSRRPLNGRRFFCAPMELQANDPGPDTPDRTPRSVAGPRHCFRRVFSFSRLARYTVEAGSSRVAISN